MANWTAPKTWVALETVTASLLNTHMRDNEDVLSKRVISITLGDTAGPTLTTGVKGYLHVPMGLLPTGWTIIADTSSTANSIVVDVWRTTFPTIPSSTANSIAGTERPTITSTQTGQDLALSTWTTGIVAGDVLAFVVMSVSTVKQATISLNCTVA